MSYRQISANNFVVNLAVFYECPWASPNNGATIALRAPGCFAGRSQPMTLVSQIQGKPYGPAVPFDCASYILPHYVTLNYTTTITFSPAELTCADWVISWSEPGIVGSVENMATTTDIYTEVKLKLNAGLFNSSPAFDTLNAPLLFVNANRLYNLNVGAIDPDGDSLVYSLVAPLKAENTPATYSPHFGAQAGSFIQNPTPKPPYHNPFNPQIAQLQGTIPATFGPNYPIPSGYVNWDGPATISYPGPGGGQMIWAATPTFQRNPATGDLRFFPSVFNTTGGLGRNRYQVSVLVEEYRKINGVAIKLGSIRRETIIQVFDNPTQNPVFGTVIANNLHVPNGTVITLRPGTPLNLQFTSSDPDAADLLQVRTNARYILPGATFTASTGNSISGAITWTPTAAQVRWQPYYFQILVRDNANPLRGLHSETIVVRVSATGGVTGTKELPAEARFTAYPNPFSSELNFRFNLKTKAESIVIYNLLGQQVDRISLANIGIGEQQLQWQKAGKYAAGTYVAKLVSADKTIQTLKFTKLQ